MQRFKDLQDINLHFSKFLNTKIILNNNQKIGNLSDFFVDYEEIFPSVLAIQYKKNRQFYYIKWEDIIYLSYEKIIVNDDFQKGQSRTYPKASRNKVVTSILANQFTGETIEYPSIGHLIIDKQIVDTNGKKVVRVNDLQMIRSGQELRITHAEVGFSSMVRRLGFSFSLPIIQKILTKYRNLVPHRLINWKYVHAIPNKNINSKLQLTLSNQDIKKMHPADLADILEDLDTQGRNLIFKDLDNKQAADTLSEIEGDLKASLIKDKSPVDVANIISEMDTDDAADILNDLPENRQDEIISNISDNETQEEIQELLEYEDDVAGGLMTTDVFTVMENQTKREVVEKLKTEFEDYPILHDIYVINDTEKLIGTLQLSTLTISSDDTVIKDIMIDHDIKKLLDNSEWEDVAQYLSKYNLITVPVVDHTNELLGMISVDDILPWLLDEKN